MVHGLTSLDGDCVTTSETWVNSQPSIHSHTLVSGSRRGGEIKLILCAVAVSFRVPVSRVRTRTLPSRREPSVSCVRPKLGEGTGTTESSQ